MTGVTAPDTGPTADFRVTETLCTGAATVVYRARRLADNAPAVLKVLRSDRFEQPEVDRLHEEYELTRRLGDERVVRVVAMEELQGRPMIVFEDAGGVSLDRLMEGGALGLDRILEIGIQVAQGLDRIHQGQVVHRDINPGNIVYNPATGAAQIIDFGIAGSVGEGNTLPTVLPQGSLPYIAPEQTGRMHRDVDYRADYYAFGATLYELMTGRRMFEAPDAAGWIHCHIAKQPPAPAELDPAIPAVLSDLVMKLLAKTPEERYQSSQGIEADLRQCLRALKEYGRVEPFVLGTRDTGERLDAPSCLIGRDGAAAQLLASFERVAAGAAELVLVSGRPGMGKTALIRELRSPVMAAGGYFVTGECDRLHRNVPLHALTKALQELVRQLLAEPEASLSRWRERLDAALGRNGQLIIDVIPELALVIGEQPAPPPLGDRESERRFNHVFQAFIAAFASADHPLVIFMDDLQWADAATLKLLERLLRDAATGYLQVIAAYRSQDVERSGRLSRGLAGMRADGFATQEIVLGALDGRHIVQWLTAALGSDVEDVEALADLVLRKTAGNPFFIDEFLKSVAAAGILAFDHEQGRWRWDRSGLQAWQVTENVVDLITVQLRRLSDRTQRLVQLASCIGNPFSLALLARVAHRPKPEVEGLLREAVADGMIAPVRGEAGRSDGGVGADSAAFAFTHDRVQQGAYAQMTPAERETGHLAIARAMASAGEDAMESRAFDIANQYNLAASLVRDGDERIAVCRFNLEAGRQAKASNAYMSAAAYLEQARDSLPRDAWRSHYDLALDVFVEAADAANLNGDYERLGVVVDEALPHARTLLDAVRLHEVRLRALTARGEMVEAIRLGLSLLEELGVHFPEKPTRREVRERLAALLHQLREVSVEDLRAMPPMQDPRQLAVRRIAKRIGGPAYLVRPALFSLLVFDGVGSSIRYGRVIDTPAYASFGVILTAVLGRYEEGARFGRLALDMVEELGADHLRPRVQHVYTAFIRHWLEPVQETLQPLREVHQRSIDTGDFEFAAHGANIYAYNALSCGVPLARYAADMAHYRHALHRLNQDGLIHYTRAAHQLARNLIGRDDQHDPARLVGDSYDIDRMLAVHERAGDRPMVLAAHFYAFHLAYHFGDYEGALAHTDAALRNLDTALGGYTTVITHFYDSLSRLAVCEAADSGKRRRLLRQVARNQAKMREWAHHNPHNCANKLALVEAERNRLRGRHFKAMALYDEAIAAARSSGFLQEEAIACELAAAMHLASDRLTVGEAYMQRAYETTARWGAGAKIEALRRRYPRLANAAVARERPSTLRETQTVTGPVADLDMGALIKALKAIADEPVHSRMLDTIIRTAVEFAGAQQGVLMLRDGHGGLCVDAEYSVDGGEPRILQSIPVAESTSVCQMVVNYVARTRTSLVVHDAQQPHDSLPGLRQAPYVRSNGVRSVLCLPISVGTRGDAEPIGVLYLENNRASDCFTEERFGMLEIICLSAAGRLELSRKAAVDGLTELFNHDYFQKMLQQELAVASRQQRNVSLILADIDHFKRFNDTWGHQVGDRVLREVARTIRAQCRDADVPARYGGEEIAVILPDCDLDAACVVAERLRRAVAALAVEHAGEALTVTLSLGVAAATSGQAPEALIGQADAALYRSKGNGRNRVSTA